MTTEQIREYLDQGGTDLQYVLEWIERYTTDEQVREVIGQLWENIENE